MTEEKMYVHVVVGMQKDPCENVEEKRKNE